MAATAAVEPMLVLRRDFCDSAKTRWLASCRACSSRRGTLLSLEARLGSITVCTGSSAAPRPGRSPLGCGAAPPPPVARIGIDHPVESGDVHPQLGALGQAALDHEF